MRDLSPLNRNQNYRNTSPNSHATIRWWRLYIGWITEGHILACSRIEIMVGSYQYQNALLQFRKSTSVNLQINLITYYLHVWYDTSNHSHLAYKLGLPTFLDSVESVLLPLASADIQVSTYCLCLAFVVTRKKFSLLTCVFFLLPSFSVLYSLFLLVMPLI